MYSILVAIIFSRISDAACGAARARAQVDEDVAEEEQERHTFLRKREQAGHAQPRHGPLRPRRRGRRADGAAGVRVGQKERLQALTANARYTLEPGKYAGGEVSPLHSSLSLALLWPQPHTRV